MRNNTQVDTSHYDYGEYQSAERFTSFYYQLRYILESRPKSVLEVGIGDGLLLAMLRHYGVRTWGMDLDPALQPSLCGSVLGIPLQNESMDTCAAFQVLEHLPFESLGRSARELARVCRRHVIISLPEHGNAGLVLSLPYVRKIRIHVPNLLLVRPQHKFDGQHYWEINKRGYPRARIIDTFQQAGLTCESSMLNPYNPYHRFFKFSKQQAAGHAI